MKRLVLSLLVFCLFVPSLASASSFEEAMTSTSALVPSTKPFSGRTAYVKTEPYIEIKSLADKLNSSVNKKITFTSSQTKKSKAAAKTKLNISSALITKRNTDATAAIEKSATDRTDTLYAAADEDYGAALDLASAEYIEGESKAYKIKAGYLKEINGNLAIRIESIKSAPVRISVSKKFKKKIRTKMIRAKKRAAKKYKKNQIKAAKKSAKISKDLVNGEYAKEVERLSAEQLTAEEAAGTAYDANLTKADTTVEAEKQAAIKALASETRKERTSQNSQENRIERYLNKLSKGTSGSIDVDKETPAEKAAKAAAKKKAAAKRKAAAKKKAAKKRAATKKRRERCRKGLEKAHCVF